jgi:hypothetical protein
VAGKPLKVAASPPGRRKGKAAKGGAKLKQGNSTKPGRTSQAMAVGTPTEVVCHPANPGLYVAIRDCEILGRTGGVCYKISGSRFEYLFTSLSLLPRIGSIGVLSPFSRVWLIFIDNILDQRDFWKYSRISLSGICYSVKLV